jgi:hypothetical protein
VSGRIISRLTALDSDVSAFSWVGLREADSSHVLQVAGFSRDVKRKATFGSFFRDEQASPYSYVPSQTLTAGHRIQHLALER